MSVTAVAWFVTVKGGFISCVSWEMVAALAGVVVSVAIVIETAAGFWELLPLLLLLLLIVVVVVVVVAVVVDVIVAVV